MKPRTVKGNVIDLDIWWHRLTEDQRDEARDLVHRTLVLKRPCIQFEYLPDQHPKLRVTYRIRRDGDSGPSLLDPSCTCGPGGKPIHLWDLTVDCDLAEPLPVWWHTEAA